MIKHGPRHDYVYRDWHNRISYRIIWPQYRTIVYYSYGPWYTYRCVYPYYLRKYAFVSIGGYWPVHYSYLRYYWYGYHPYVWQGYYPIATEVAGNTYNYYTYNYYGDTTQPSQSVIGGSNQITPVDHNTFADVRARMALQQAQEPATATVADIYFEEAVKAFEKADYTLALEKFALARQNAPEDMVLPFAYAQTLFAKGQYTEAAATIRQVVENLKPETEGVLYPRGLYAKEEVLFEQIVSLAEKAELNNTDSDLQLLLGYHLLGIGETDQAIGPLEQAIRDPKNARAAAVLLDLAKKVQMAEATAKAEEEKK